MSIASGHGFTCLLVSLISTNMSKCLAKFRFASVLKILLSESYALGATPRIDPFLAEEQGNCYGIHNTFDCDQKNTSFFARK